MVVLLGRLVFDFCLTKNTPSSNSWRRSSAHCRARTNGADSEWLKLAGQGLEGPCAADDQEWAFLAVVQFAQMCSYWTRKARMVGKTMRRLIGMVGSKKKRGQFRGRAKNCYDRDLTVRSECGLVALAGCLPPCIPLPDSGGLQR